MYYRRGDMVVYEGKKYHFNPEGTVYHLHRYSNDLGFPGFASIRNLPLESADEVLTHAVHDNVRNDLHDGEIVLYKGQLLRYNNSHTRIAGGIDYDDTTHLLGKNGQILHQVRYPELATVETVPFEPGDKVLFRGLVYTVSYEIGDYDCRLIDHDGNTWHPSAFKADTPANGIGKGIWLMLNEMKPFDEKQINLIYLFNKLTLLEKKLLGQ